MKLPRFRFTVRRLMIVVAGSAVIAWGLVPRDGSLLGEHRPGDLARNRLPGRAPGGRVRRSASQSPMVPATRRTRPARARGIPMKRPRFTIRTLMILVALTAVLIATMLLALRLLWPREFLMIGD